MMDLSASSSKDMATEDKKCIEEKPYEDQTDKVQKKFVLPQEYDENDSRWTLKYRGPAPGLVELIKHSGVYVNASTLANCKRLSRDCKSLARILLTEIFSTSALITCSWTSEATNASDIHGRQARPGLDEHARKILLIFVEEFGLIHDWNITDYQCFLNSLRQLILEMRRDKQDSHKQPKERKEENYLNELLKKIKVTNSRQLTPVMRCVRRSEDYDKLLKNYPHANFRQTMVDMIHDLQKKQEHFYFKLLGRTPHTRQLFFPPEYDENDSRWTLKYREPAPGLVELMPHSGVYVHADNLAECEKSNNSVTLTRMLLNEIFTTSALHACSWISPTAEDSGGANIRPVLNENAMKTFLNFVGEFALDNDWMVTHDKYTQSSSLQKLKFFKAVENIENTSRSLEEAKLEEEIHLITRKPSNAIIDVTVSPIKDTTVEVTKLNEDQTDDDDEVQEMINFLPDNDENDSKWTSKYPELTPGLNEVKFDSSVYVDADKLLPGNDTQIRMLLTGNFIECCKSQSFRKRWKKIRNWIRRTFCCCCMKRCSGGFTFAEN